MEVNKEQENFYRIFSLFHECIVPQLREFFLNEWQGQFAIPWYASKDNPNKLLNLSNDVNRRKHVRNRILHDKVNNWDVTCVAKALLALNIKSFQKDCIHILQNFRNTISHHGSGKVSDKEKDSIFIKVNKIYDDLSWPKDAIRKFEYEPLTTEYVKQLKTQLDDERRAALKEGQTNLCKLPEEVGNFVGRENVLKELSEILNLENDKKFLIITGGPCFGKSSVAVKLGYEMYDKGYSYVIWINMRDITRNPSNPSLEDIALNILQKFNIDTFQMQGDMVGSLVRKLEMITDDSKSTLLIFDNADNLIEPERDKSCQSTEFEKLCHLIADIKGSWIRCIFTSRVCTIDMNRGKHRMNLGHLSDVESRLFLNNELHSLPVLDQNTLIDDFVAISCGLPYALKLMCSEVVKMTCKKMIMDYINILKKNPADTVDDIMANLFNLSYERLNEAERKLFTSLVIFPSSFSYLYSSMVVKNLESIVILQPTVLNALTMHSLVSVDAVRYLIHPFLREFVKSKHWTEDSRKQYEIAYYKVYLSQLFELARKSLGKDNLAGCLEEFRSEQQNFLHVMAEVGKGWENSPSHLRDLVKAFLERSTSDYITLLIFYYRELYSADMIEFFKGCETFVEGQMKKNIWCCRFYINLKSFEKRIDDDYSDIEPDEYGKAIVETLQLSLIMGKHRGKKDFEEAMSSLEKYRAWADTLDDCKMKAYFKCITQKIKVRLSKRVYKLKSCEIDKNKLIQSLEEVRDICESNFGLHRITIDCHSQLGKLYWFLGDAESAKASFDKGIAMAGSLAISQNSCYISCLLEEGRFLIDSKSRESISEGKCLIEGTLHHWKGACDEFMWFLAMKALVTVDGTKFDELVNKFLKQKRLFRLSLGAMDSAVVVQLEYSDEEVNEENFDQKEQLMVGKVRQVVDHLERICNTSEHNDERLLQDAILYTYVWNMWIATRCMHALSESDTKHLASRALNIMKSHGFIRSEKREELSYIMNCDHEKFVLLRKKCYIEQKGKRIPAIKNDLENDLENLLVECEKHQDVWSWVIRGLARGNKKLYEKVMPYFLRQSEPRGSLLALVLHMFIHQIEAYKKESYVEVSPEESIPAVRNMLRAIAHVEGLLANSIIMQGGISSELEDALKRWYTQLAIRTKQCLSRAYRGKYAGKALNLLEDEDTFVSEKERQMLMNLAS